MKEWLRSSGRDFVNENIKKERKKTFEERKKERKKDGAK